MCECDLISYNANESQPKQENSMQPKQPRFLQRNAPRPVQRAMINQSTNQSTNQSIGGDNATNRVSDKERKEVPS